MTRKIVFGLIVGLLVATVNTAAAAEPTKALLGKILYFDTYLSLNHNQACASCHTPPGFADPRNAADPVNNVVSLGSDETLNGGRNAPPSGYAAFSPIFYFDDVAGLYIGGQFWDGRAPTLADQAKGPFLNPVEMAMPSKTAVLEALVDRNNPNRSLYRALFLVVYRVQLVGIYNWDAAKVDQVYDQLADAIQAFEQTRFFSRFNSKYDYVLAGRASFTPAEQRGFDLFNAKAQCFLCHPSEATVLGKQVLPPLFTDFTYDNLGIPESQSYLIKANRPDYGLGENATVLADAIAGGAPTFQAVDDNGDPVFNDLGEPVLVVAAEAGKFKVSSLRNIALTPPYGHNGYFATLEEIVHFYNTRDVPEAAWPPAEVPDTVNHNELGNLGLTPQEEADLVAFLKTLSDGYGLLLGQMPPLPY